MGPVKWAHPPLFMEIGDREFWIRVFDLEENMAVPEKMDIVRARWYWYMEQVPESVHPLRWKGICRFFKNEYSEVGH